MKRQNRKPSATAATADRVRELRRVRAGDLVPHPKNWRLHPEQQRAALRGILKEVGYCSALTARELPDGRLQLIDGHLRAETTPDEEVPVLVVDVSELESDKLLMTLDPLAALADTNERALEQLLGQVQTGDEGLASMYAGLAEAAGLLEDGQPVVNPVELKTPPRMAWALIGIPVVRFGEVQAMLESIGQIEGVSLQTVANDAEG